MQKKIFLVEKQEHWRNLFSEALADAGYRVSIRSDYPRSAKDAGARSNVFDLIVLMCTRIDSEEKKLIENLLEKGNRILVLCAYLSWQERRTLFLAGVYDVADRPYQSDKFVAIVKDTLRSISLPSGYQLAERKNAL